ncbi:filamentous hemagglutinin N-terminal domain-containing protein, partial [Bradyrhizobium brasilense]|uniref:two-partner secretion domain-containing protein n=1 Tax=Bradyrhizobium brasilense TaxID=1419277 RepID=UPI00145741F4
SLGVDLDNRPVNARTILNEVTSSRISNLNGPLDVLGARAHVIVANPNGISVDGASFRNTGGVVLSTGKASVVSRQITSGSFQDNVVLKTEGGTIDIGAGGLSGAMSTLHLLAGRIRVDGPVENSSPQLRS